jgi:DNA-binding NtrC family response regulator
MLKAMVYVHVRLPATFAVRLARQDRERNTVAKLMKPITILVVDNDEDVREGLCRLLRRAGYTVDVAANGMEALKYVQHHPCQLVITDMLMPGMGGLTLLERLRELRPGLPVLVVTAFGDWGSYSRAIELNAAAYLTKPFRSEELQREVQRALSTTRDETVGRASSQS